MQSKIVIALLIGGLAAPLFTWMYFRSTIAPTQLPHVKTAGIAPPLKSVDIPMDNYRFSNDSAFEIARPTGTRIKFKPRTFYRKDGKPLNGPVEFQVREFHSAMDILRAGITMAVDAENGEYLQSGGMIEMRAFNEGQALEVADQKSLEVSLAGFRKPEQCRLYFLKNDKEWAVTDTFENGANTVKAETLKKLSVLPAKPGRDDSSQSDDHIFYFEGDFRENPKLTILADRGWSLLDETYRPELSRIIRISWDDVTVTPVNKRKNIYEVVLTRKMYIGSGNEVLKSERFLATPVISARGNDQAFFDFQMKQYEQLLEDIKKEEERVRQEADLVNVFRADKLGVYNIDRIWKCDPKEIVPVTFDFTMDLDPAVNKTIVYGIYEEDNSVIPFSLGGQKTQTIIPEGKRMRFVAVLPGEKIAVVDYEAIKNANAGKMKKLFLKSKKYPAEEFLKKT